MLILESVTKTYRSGLKAVDNLSMTLGPGIVGLLGPNGAGKSTLMNMLATISKPSAGRILFRGKDLRRSPEQMRAVLGYLPQDFGVYDGLSAYEFMAFLGGLKGVGSRGRILEALEAVNLHNVAFRPIRSFSGGMKQRLGIAQAIVNKPEVLIVDEPTVGLDPEERMRFRSMMTTLGSEVLVILSTHIVSDVEAVAGTIALMHRGKLVHCGTPESLIARAQGHVFEGMVSSEEFQRVRSTLRIVSAAQESDGVRVRFVGPNALGGAATEVRPVLEDAFLHLTASQVAA